MKIKIDLIAAARPNFMKVGPLQRALRAEPELQARLIHTGQHYDANMADVFFRDLGLGAPDVSLGIGSGSHAEQTGGVMIAYERLCRESPPDLCVVVGDVNSTVACTLAATKAGIRVAHLEAGLRSRDRRMPEELNRLATDVLADLLWTPSEDANRNLASEGIPPGRVELVGNIMIDSFELLRSQISAREVRKQFGLEHKGYGVVTLHRPSNVDEVHTLARLVDLILESARIVPLVFPVHPRTRSRLLSAGLLERLEQAPSLRMTEPLGYIEFMSLVLDSGLVLTDSGGVQEETSYLGIPCLTLRENTERPVTVDLGTNRLVTMDGMVEAVRAAATGSWPKGQRIPLWDGNTAGRIVDSIKRNCGTGR